MSDAVERLRRKAQNVATVFALRDLCNDQQKEIETLRQRVNELRLKAVIADMPMSQVEAHLKEQLAACEKERDAAKHEVMMRAERESKLFKELAASQHYAQQLREALEAIKSRVCGERAPNWVDDFCVTQMRGLIADDCDVALSLPHDTSALDALVKDAERYRWLRSYNTSKHKNVTEAFYLGDEKLDAAIDRAMNEVKE